jgi:hypothetical protein
MYPTSDAFRQAVRQSHTAVSTAEVWRGLQKILDLDISDGSVSVSVNQSTRRTCTVGFSVSASDNDLIPSTPFDAITPFGNEIRLYRGVQFADGSREMVPLGVFVITSVEMDQGPDQVKVTVSGVDRSLRVSGNVWLEPYQVPAGPLTTALTNLLQNRWPAIELSFPTLAVNVQQQVLGQDAGNDPWKDAVYLAEMAGYDLFFDANGVCVLQPFPSPDSASVVATYTDEDVLVKVRRQDTTEDTYNGVVYIVESSWLLVPYRVEVWDLDPNSPTYRYGAFGEVPKIVSQSAITDSNAATTAAAALLAKGLGLAQNVTWESTVDPALDVNDVVLLRNSGTKTERVLIVDQVTIPLSPSAALSAQARTVRVVE